MATTSPQAFDSFLADLPKVEWRPNFPLFHWKGFWLEAGAIKSAIAIENQFNPLPSDILLVSFPKSGTTWLKALTISILGHNSNRKSNSQIDPLQTHNPHELVPFLEWETSGENPSQDINKFPSPRVFHTHLPYTILPVRVMNSGCRIIYICRNPADTFASSWHFYNKIFNTNVSLEEAFDEFYRGTVLRGPFFDHVLEYWIEREKENVFFVTYEELKAGPNKQVRELAEFLGCSLSPEEIEQVVWKCSHERLSNLDVNKGGGKVDWAGVEFSSFFRRGVVGDGKNLLTAEMIERIDALANQR